MKLGRDEETRKELKKGDMRPARPVTFNKGRRAFLSEYRARGPHKEKPDAKLFGTTEIGEKGASAQIWGRSQPLPPPPLLARGAKTNCVRDYVLLPMPMTAYFRLRLPFFLVLFYFYVPRCSVSGATLPAAHQAPAQRCAVYRG